MDHLLKQAPPSIGPRLASAALLKWAGPSAESRENTAVYLFYPHGAA
jgi:hypothetical protein